MAGKEWGNAEITKPFEDRHPVLQWYQQLCDFQIKHSEHKDGEIHTEIASGPVMAYLWLAYDLYTLDHHSLLQKKLINRLKVRDQFQGARYETSVAAAFIRAGFEIDLEDEGDRGKTHCEFNAKHKETGLKYSIEAKSRHRPGLLGQTGPPQPLNEIEADILKLLAKALRKEADHERILFIDVNVPPHEGALFEAEWFKKVSLQLMVS